MRAPCGITEVAGVITAVSQDEHDYWPNTLYDAREASMRDATAAASTDLSLSGVMHYVELDVNNLRRWLAGQLALAGAPNGANAKNDNGYIVYFSDRRGNKNDAATPVETAEFGFEDNVNPATTAGAPNNALDAGEDANGDGTLQLYGRVARNTLGGASSAACLANFPNPMRTGPIAAGGTPVTAGADERQHWCHDRGRAAPAAVAQPAAVRRWSPAPTTPSSSAAR